MDQEKQVRVLGVVGSPRRGGNTETLVDEVLAGAEEAGASVEKVILSELQIAPCDGCAACETTGECVYQDDMSALLQKMAGSQVWVLGTPVYWWGPTAQFKVYLDRWYSKSFLPEDKAIFRGRRVVLAIPMGDSDPRTARNVVGMFEDALHFSEAILFATILAPGVDRLGEVRTHGEVMARAREAGREAVAT